MLVDKSGISNKRIRCSIFVTALQHFRIRIWPGFRIPPRSASATRLRAHVSPGGARLSQDGRSEALDREGGDGGAKS